MHGHNLASFQYIAELPLVRNLFISSIKHVHFLEVVEGVSERQTDRQAEAGQGVGKEP